MKILQDYTVPSKFIDEVCENDLSIKKPYESIFESFDQLTEEQFVAMNNAAKLSFLNQGITYQVYSNNQQVEHIFPFDLFPRIITSDIWEKMEKGILQRNVALNLFLKDVYNKQQIIKDKVVPKEMVLSSPHYCKAMDGFEPDGGVFSHISGTDLIKHTDDNFYVLEDNLRSPSGVSYVLSNRETLKKVVGNIFQKSKVRGVADYPAELLRMMQSVSNDKDEMPTCVLLTPGMYNSAYFEHAFLAQQMGIELVEGRDLFVESNVVYMKTTNGPQRVDVIYRRIDDNFLDPLHFNKDSMLGVPGLMNAYLKKKVTIINAPGTGIADDKAIYRYVPEIIKYYLGEDPIIQNVETYICERPEHLNYVVENIDKLVIKPVDQSGGYGVLIGEKLSQKEKEEVKEVIKKSPRNYVAQPIMSLSLHSTYINDEDGFEPRHIDLRSFCLLGNNTQYVLPGGLTRVALKKGSLIVNSSQGGGSKDTWVLAK